MQSRHGRDKAKLAQVPPQVTIQMSKTRAGGLGLGGRLAVDRPRAAECANSVTFLDLAGLGRHSRGHVHDREHRRG